ncbi:hypothetical protein ACJVDH_00750 [Pedobacter sp. AW1-32]|uniref:hypothetical protein n=1 Tax=Pedobacter sp. AW1-32 TaxID=3383026 RepID=UPI003FEFE544
MFANSSSLTLHGDGIWDALGYGYDIMGELYSTVNTFDAPIIDVSRFNTDYPNRITTPTYTYGHTVK